MINGTKTAEKKRKTSKNANAQSKNLQLLISFSFGFVPQVLSLFNVNHGINKKIFVRTATPKVILVEQNLVSTKFYWIGEPMGRLVSLNSYF